MRALSLIVLAAVLVVVGCDKKTPVDTNKPATETPGSPSTAPTPGAPATPGTGTPSPGTGKSP